MEAFNFRMKRFFTTIIASKFRPLQKRIFQARSLIFRYHCLQKYLVLIVWKTFLKQFHAYSIVLYGHQNVTIWRYLRNHVEQGLKWMQTKIEGEIIGDLSSLKCFSFVANRFQSNRWSLDLEIGGDTCHIVSKIRRQHMIPVRVLQKKLLQQCYFDDRVPNIRVPRAPEGELSRGCFNQSAMMKPHPTDC